jgi:hypothetical protein
MPALNSHIRYYAHISMPSNFHFREFNFSLTRLLVTTIHHHRHHITITITTTTTITTITTIIITTNESRRLVGVFSFRLHPRRWPLAPPTSHDDSLGCFLTVSTHDARPLHHQRVANDSLVDKNAPTSPHHHSLPLPRSKRESEGHFFFFQRPPTPSQTRSQTRVWVCYFLFAKRARPLPRLKRETEGAFYLYAHHTRK